MASNPAQVTADPLDRVRQANQTSRPDTDAVAGAAADPDQPGDPATEDHREGHADADEPLPLDLRYELLKNRRRRRVLEYLEDEADSTTLGTLAEHLAAEENDKPVAALTSSERKRVYICLYQCHLPKLDDAGVVEFDNDRGTVERSDRASELSSYLGDEPVADDADDPAARDRSRGYLGITSLGVGGVVLQGLLLPGIVSAHAVVALMTVSLLALSVIDAAG